MIKKLICIECPNGCELEVEIQDNKVVSVKNNKCDKGVSYAYSEIEAPVRILTTSVLAEGLSLKMLPVKTDKPIPKGMIVQAIEEVKRIKVSKPVHVGDVVAEGFLGRDVNLIATRSIESLGS